jgi:hypothetical protein
MHAMRKVLASVIRETTPNPGMKHILSESTREDVRMCFTLISTRERELAEKSGISLDMRPRYADEPKNTTVVSIDKIKKSVKKDNEDNIK